MAGSELGSAIGLQGVPRDYTGIAMQRQQMELQREAARARAKADEDAAKAKQLQAATDKWEKAVTVDPTKYHKVYQPAAKQIYSDYLEQAYNNWKNGESNKNAQLAIDTEFKLQPLQQNSAVAFNYRDGYIKGDFTDKNVYDALESGDIDKVRAVAPTAYGQWGGADEKGNLSVRQWGKFDYNKAFEKQNISKDTAYGAMKTLIPGQKNSIQLIKGATEEAVLRTADEQWNEPGKDGYALRGDILAANEDAFKKILEKEKLPATDMDIRDPNSPSGKRFNELGKEAWEKMSLMRIERDTDLQQVDLDQPKKDGSGGGGAKRYIGKVVRKQKINLGHEEAEPQLDKEGKALPIEVKELTLEAAFETDGIVAELANSPTLLDIKTNKAVKDPGVKDAKYNQFAVIPTLKANGRAIPEDYVSGKNKVPKDQIVYKVVAIGKYKEELGDTKKEVSIYRNAKEITGSAESNMTDDEVKQFRVNLKELEDEATALNGGKVSQPRQSAPSTSKPAGTKSTQIGGKTYNAR